MTESRISWVAVERAGHKISLSLNIPWSAISSGSTAEELCNPFYWTLSWILYRWLYIFFFLSQWWIDHSEPCLGIVGCCAVGVVLFWMGHKPKVPVHYHYKFYSKFHKWMAVNYSVRIRFQFGYLLSACLNSTYVFNWIWHFSLLVLNWSPCVELSSWCSLISVMGEVVPK